MACVKTRAMGYCQDWANAWVDYLLLNHGQRFYLLGYLADNPAKDPTGPGSGVSFNQEKSIWNKYYSQWII